MKYYFLSFTLDLEQDYSKLFTAIADLGDYKYIANTTWVLSCESNAIYIRNYLKQFLGYFDNILVAEISLNTAWHIDRHDGDGQRRRQDIIDETLLQTLAEIQSY